MASIPTDTGPTFATAEVRALSLPSGISLYPLQVAALAELL